MAKMFYTIEEVAAKLGKSEDEVREMAKTGQISEFRDRDKLMFKVEQIDLLAAGPEDTGDVHIPLEDTAAGGTSLELTSGASGLDLKEESAIGLTDSREGTGISVFDTDHTGTPVTADASDETQVGSDEVPEELSLEAVGSGSGLLDLTRESDDTTLGAELLEEVYAGDENLEIPANASGLFEAAGEGTPEELTAPMGAAGAAAMPMVVEAYDGSGSGLGAGMLIGALAALVCVAVIVIVGVSGATPGLAITFSSQLMVWAGGLLGVTIVFGLVGWFIGRASG
ncbi:MAG: helix-turn-helix domain-containing protein [Planctomycetota bacterium]|jgi:hypothetical protein